MAFGRTTAAAVRPAITSKRSAVVPDWLAFVSVGWGFMLRVPHCCANSWSGSAANCGTPRDCSPVLVLPFAAHAHVARRLRQPLHCGKQRLPSVVFFRSCTGVFYETSRTTITC